MRYIEALEEFLHDNNGFDNNNGYDKGVPSIFLAGGITGCSDWQTQIVELLKDENVILLNPRRKNFPIDDPKASYEQIFWEYNHLRRATAISFWFPKETLCPITLLELGKWIVSKKPLFIGIDKEYKRLKDVKLQTALERVNMEKPTFYYSIEDLAEAIRKFVRTDVNY